MTFQCQEVWMQAKRTDVWTKLRWAQQACIIFDKVEDVCQLKHPPVIHFVLSWQPASCNLWVFVLLQSLSLYALVGDQLMVVARSIGLKQYLVMELINYLRYCCPEYMMISFSLRNKTMSNYALVYIAELVRASWNCQDWEMCHWLLWWGGSYSCEEGQLGLHYVIKHWWFYYYCGSFL